MAVAFVQNAISDPGGTPTSVTATGSAVGSGNFVIGCVTFGNDTPAITASQIVDGSANAATAIIQSDVESGGPLTTATFYFQNVTNGTTSFKFTPSVATSFTGIEWQEWSGVLTSGNPIRAHALALTAGGTTTQTSPAITSTSGDGLYGCLFGSTTTPSGTFSTPGGTGGTYTLRNNGGVGGLGCDSSAISTGGSTTASFVSNGTDTWVVGITAFIPAGASADDPNYFRLRSFPSQWNRNAQLLLHRSPGPEFSIAPETNTHFIPRAFPPQWNLDRRLLNHRSPGPEFSIAPETNTHFIPHAFPKQWSVKSALWQNAALDVPSAVTPDAPPSTKIVTWRSQWARNPILLLNTAQDFSSSAVETNPHWIAKSWPKQWSLTYKLWQTDPQDFSSSAVETNPHWLGKSYPPQWARNPILLLDTAQDFSSSAVETNPHWTGKPWGPQWYLERLLLTNEARDVPVVTTPDTPPSFVPLQWESQWNVDVSWVHGGGNDESSSAVETNVHTIFKTWPVQWVPTKSLQLNTDTVSTFVAQPETNTFFIPRTWPLQWTMLLRTQNTAQDFSSSAVETNPHWIGKQWPVQWSLVSLLRSVPNDAPAPVQLDTPPHWVGRLWPVQWNLQPALRETPADDVPPSQPETNTFFIPRTWPLQWQLTKLLRFDTAQDFSSSAVETNVYFIPRSWPPRWNLQASLMRGTAQDFSTAPIVRKAVYNTVLLSIPGGMFSIPGDPPS